MKKSILALLSILLFPSLTYAKEDQQRVQTRLGLARVTNCTTLLIANEPTNPPIIASEFMSIQKITQTKDADYLLVGTFAGAGSAGLISYSIVKVTKSNAIPTAFFGNGTDAPTVKTINKTKIVISFAPFENQYIKEKTGSTVIYDIPTGTLKVNGKPFNATCQNNICQGS